MNKFLILSTLAVSLILKTGGSAAEKPAPTGQMPSQSPAYTAKDYSKLLGMPGFSDSLLNMHFQLYQGYVTNTNLLLNSLKDLSAKGQAKSYEYGALKRRLGWEFDGMRLHEFYFENLGGKNTLAPSSPLYQSLTKEFGSFEAWKNDFIATGAMRGIGWAILYRDPISGRLVNVWINEHDLGHLAGATPLLVMDVFEHAYMPQYGLDRAKYIEAFFGNINWDVVNKRATAASSTSASAGNVSKPASSGR